MLVSSASILLAATSYTAALAVERTAEHGPQHGGLGRRQTSTSPPSLRILPLGDSITQGWQSTAGNGWRPALRNALLSSGASVEYIGSMTSGTDLADSRHEGYGGNTTSQILSHIQANGILKQQPNLVLLHAGTNDLKMPSPPPQPYDTTPDRLGALIDEVLCQAPDAVVLVAQLIADVWAQDRTDTYNTKVPDVVAKRQAKGFKVKTVDHTNVKTPFEADGLHPNDDGYALMAENWLQALQGLQQGWLTQPRQAIVDIVASDACPKTGPLLAPSPTSSPAPLKTPIDPYGLPQPGPPTTISASPTTLPSSLVSVVASDIRNVVARPTGTATTSSAASPSVGNAAWYIAASKNDGALALPCMRLLGSIMGIAWALTYIE